MSSSLTAVRNTATNASKRSRATACREGTMRGKNGQSLEALTWAAAALLSGVLLHVDRAPLWATAAALLCVVWRFAHEFRPIRLPGTFAKVGVMLLLLLAVLAQFKTVNGLSAGTALLVVMGSLKLLETHTQRDRQIVIGVSLFLLLAACLDRQSLLRAPLYLIHAWICCAALGVMTRGNVGMSNRTIATLAARSLLLALPLALVLFLFFPRMAGAFWTLPQSEAATTGLSDSMSPGSISSLGESDEPAFRVHFESDAPPPEERYWRGPVLHEFDGYTWRQSPGQYYMRSPLQYVGKEYRYSVTLEPTSQRWWFALDTVAESPDRRRVRLTFDQQLVSHDPVTRLITYNAVSYTQTRSDGPAPVIARRVDTRLPPNRNLRSVALAKEMRSRAGSDQSYIASVLDLFRQGGFEYTLTPPLLNLDSVDDFLFNTKRGFCGHYASAFVTLMRAADIPARVVTGYQGGEWNPIRKYYLVRQSDAHAWAEVWIDGRGWMRVDPTAVVAPERLRRGLLDLLPDSASTTTRILRQVTWISELRQTWDAANDWWNERVVHFDFRTQIDLLRWLGFDTPDWRILGYLLASGLIAWLIVIAWHVSRTSRRAPADRLARAYEKLCGKLARAGAPREPHEGPLAYAMAIATRRPDLAVSANGLLMSYAGLRFGNDLDDRARSQAIAGFEQAVSRFRAGRSKEAFPAEWRAILESSLPIYSRMPAPVRASLEPLAAEFLRKMRFVGCDGLVVTDEMRLVIAAQACLLIAGQHGKVKPYEELMSVLLYPDEFVVNRETEDEAGVVTKSEDVLSGESHDTSRVILSWRYIKEPLETGDLCNVVLHEFAHYLDHSIDGVLTDLDGRNEALRHWHDVLAAEFEAHCEAVEREEDTLIEPDGAEHPSEFFAYATEVFFEAPLDLKERHPKLYDGLKTAYGLDPASW
jgi:Mlc titration factor MtfA (ptsG expression regulator)/transglutaminase-like putative cysteine protease